MMNLHKGIWGLQLDNCSMNILFIQQNVLSFESETHLNQILIQTFCSGSIPGSLVF